VAYDPTKPINGSLISAGELRAQFTGLKTLIDAVPVGPPGPAGPVGPAGPAGAEGAVGPEGPQGDAGPAGPAGPSNIYVQEGDPGGADGDFWLRPSDGTAFRREGGNWSDKGTLKGVQGDPGPAGPQGPEGPQGPMGEVTTQQLNDGIAAAVGGTANNVNGVQPLGLALSDPPVTSEIQQILDKLNETINGLHR